jgi:hypothetical protein
LSKVDHYIALSLLTFSFCGYFTKKILPVPKEKLLPITLENFSEGDIDQVDEILEKIIRYVGTAEIKAVYLLMDEVLELIR